MAYRRLLAALWLAACPVVASASAPTLEECDARVLDAPDDPGSYYCFTLSVRTHGRAEEAVRRLDALLAIRPDRHRARLSLGFIEEMRGNPRAEELFRGAAAGAAETGDRTGEVYARLAVSNLVSQRGLLDEADEELERALRAAEASGSRNLLAWVRMNQAHRALMRFDHGKARRLYKRAEALAFPEGDPQLQGRILSGLGNICWHLGELSTAMDYFRREAEQWRRGGDAYAEAGVLHNIATLGSRLEDLGRIDAEESEALALEALEAAVRTGNRHIETEVRLLMGQNREGRAAIAEFERALAVGQEVGDTGSRLLAQRLIAKEKFWLGPEQRAEAWRMLDLAIEEARSLGTRFDVARGLILRAAFAWDSRPTEEAVAAYREAFDAVERIRNLQPEGRTRARVFSQWVYPYYRLSGRLLGSLNRSARPDEDLDVAFRTIERMRARVLLDSLDAAGFAPADERARSLHAARAEVLKRISALQAELMDPDLEAEPRKRELENLEALEVEESDLRDRIARVDPAFASIRAPRLASLREIRDALGEDRVLLAFQLPFDRYLDEGLEQLEGGAWVLAVTRDDARAFPLPRRHVLEQQIEVFLGLFERRDGSEAGASVYLFRDLLQDALAWLPDRITRLVIVPDEVLHRLPFTALRERVGAAPLATRFEISYVPSATLWLRWLRDARSGVGGETLAIADPEVPGGTDAAERTAAADWIAGLSLGSLPHARREAKALMRHTGGGTLRTGPDASESFLKEADLGRFGILHLATHAVVHELHPHRSAVVLAPGSPDEDGLLQIREIVELDLDGKLVILAACRSARGEVLQGEGVLGLARAFYQAGARAVLASLWPMRDDDAAALMEEFARQLARGLTVAGAMAAARRSRIAAGAPAEAWAGLVVLGDGDLSPVSLAAERAGRLEPTLWIVVPLAALSLAFLLWYRRVLGTGRRTTRKPEGH